MMVMVMCNDIVTIEHDRRRLGLSNAPVVMEHDNNRTEELTPVDTGLDLLDPNTSSVHHRV